MSDLYRLYPSGEIILIADGEYAVLDSREAADAARSILAGGTVYCETGTLVADECDAWRQSDPAS